jgi:Protein of unknown function (DUF3300)
MNTITLRVLAVALMFALSQAALAQTPPPAQPVSAPAQQPLTGAQLDALVSPIALYPDAVLSEVLMASTYPLEVIEADRWATANKSLKGDALKAAVDQQSWDDSVKSLVATPDVLDMMSNKLDWTQQLGDAVLAQQPDLMDAIQRLRTKAQANNKLASNKQQTVSTQQQSGKQVIVIAPTDPNVVYLPYYDPSVVYGPWPYPAYPPYYWPPPAYIGGAILATGLAFGAGYALGRWASGGCCWGGGFNWGGNNINVNRNININNIGNNNWVHNPAHRQGVRYNNAAVAQKFGGNRANIGGGAQNRMDFRGRNGQQVLQPGGGGSLPNLGGGGNGPRPSTGNLTPGGNRPGAGGAGTNRPGGNNRAAITRPAGNNALGNISSGKAANIQSARGQASLGGGGGGGGLARGGGGGGVARGGGGGGGAGRGGGGGGGGRRSDVRLKHDMTLLARLDNGIGVYRFVYNGEDKAYVGVLAQEVQAVMPKAVIRGQDGYLRVFYDKLGLKFQTYDQWIASGARMTVTAEPLH